MLVQKKRSAFSWQKLFLSFIIIISFNACDILDKGSSKCDETTAQWYDLDIIPDVKIVHQNGDSFSGYVKFEVYKEYCDGTISGAYSKEVETSVSGLAKFYYKYTYVYKNKKDKVYFKYTINQGDNSYTEKGEISYDVGLHISTDVSFMGNDKRETRMDQDYFDEEPIRLWWNIEDVHSE